MARVHELSFPGGWGGEGEPRISVKIRNAFYRSENNGKFYFFRVAVVREGAYSTGRFLIYRRRTRTYIVYAAE